MQEKDVFVSYSHSDKTFVKDELEPFFKKNDVRYFLDLKDIEGGGPIDATIERGLGASTFYLGLISESSVRRPWFKAELAWAIENRLPSERLLLMCISGYDDSLLPPKIGGHLKIMAQPNNTKDAFDKLNSALVDKLSLGKRQLETALADLKQKNFESAVRYSEQAIESDPKSYRAWNIRAKALYESANKAKEHLPTDSLNNCPLTSEIRKLLLRALESISNSLKINKLQDDARILRAQIRINLSSKPELKSAITELRQLLQDTPKNLAANRSLAAALLKDDQFEECVIHYESVAKNHGVNDETFRTHYALALMEMFEFQKAIQQLEELKVNSSRNALNFYLMQAYESLDDWKTAISYGKLFVERTQGVRGYYRLSLLHMEAGEYKEAIEMATKALQKGEHKHSRIVRSFANLQLNDVVEAEKDCKILINLSNGRTSFRVKLLEASILARKGSLEEAILICERMVGKHPCAKAYDLLSEFYAKKFMVSAKRSDDSKSKECLNLANEKRGIRTGFWRGILTGWLFFGDRTKPAERVLERPAQCSGTCCKK